MRRPQSEPKAGPNAHHATPESELTRLERENRRLQSRLAALTEEVGRNDSLLRKTQDRELELLRAGSLTQLFERLIADVLGLSHALNIAFFTALADSGEAAPSLARMSSTTFDAQLDVAARVAEESPELYYEIQSLNDYGAESLEALSQAVERLRTAVLSQDHDAFVALMRRGRDYLHDRRSVTERRA